MEFLFCLGVMLIIGLLLFIIVNLINFVWSSINKKHKHNIPKYRIIEHIKGSGEKIYKPQEYYNYKWGAVSTEKFGNCWSCPSRNEAEEHINQHFKEWQNSQIPDKEYKYMVTRQLDTNSLEERIKSVLLNGNKS